MDALSVLTGPRMQERPILKQVLPVYDQYGLIQHVFARNEVDVNDIDHDRYVILKRTAEVG